MRPNVHAIYSLTFVTAIDIQIATKVDGQLGAMTGHSPNIANDDSEPSLQIFCLVVKVRSYSAGQKCNKIK